MEHKEQAIAYISSILNGFISSPFQIDTVEDRDKIILSIHNLTQEDYFKVIGYKGETANALRQIIRTWAKSHETKYTIYVPNPFKK